MVLEELEKSRARTNFREFDAGFLDQCFEINLWQ